MQTCCYWMQLLLLLLLKILPAAAAEDTAVTAAAAAAAAAEDTAVTAAAASAIILAFAGRENCDQIMLWAFAEPVCGRLSYGIGGHCRCQSHTAFLLVTSAHSL